MSLKIETPDYQPKIRSNISAGRLALETGNFVPFESRAVETEKTIGLVLLLPDKPTIDKINQRVIEPLEKLAKENNVAAIFAGRNMGDLPVHITLDRVVLNHDTSLDEVRRIFKKGHVELLRKYLYGLSFSVNTLVIAPNTYICADNTALGRHVAFRARTLLGKIWGDTGREKLAVSRPISFTDIFHISVMRFLDNSTTKEATSFLKRTYEEVGSSLATTPINFRTEDVFVGTSLDYELENNYQFVS